MSSLIEMECQLKKNEKVTAEWDIEMLEALNYVNSLTSRLASVPHYFEIFLFRKHNDSGYLVNTRCHYMEDKFTRSQESIPIYLLEDTMEKIFFAIHPKNDLVSIYFHVVYLIILILLY